MGQYSIKVEKSAQKELQIHYKSGDQTVIKKIEQIFEELLEHPLSGTGKPEMLKHKLTGMWSRRINREHRIIYEINRYQIFTHSAKGHY